MSGPTADAGTGGRLPVAVFISPHGFGHAARASAVMAAVDRVVPATFHIHSSVPAWFFRGEVGDFRIHPGEVDIGLVQACALDVDLEATVATLDGFLPFDDALVERLAAQVAADDCRLVLCDIAPLGIAVARAAGVPSLLLENFTWQWIYDWYGRRDERFAGFAGYLGRWFEAADWHVRTEPVCGRSSCDLIVPPIARPIRVSREAVRAALDAELDAPLVFFSMGGVPERIPHLAEAARRFPGYRFVVAAHGGAIERHGNVTVLPADSGFSHPSLIDAVDLVIGKLGYSTIAEVWQAGVPFAGVSRDDYPEMAPLEAFVVREIAGTVLTPKAFRDGRWLDDLPRLLELPRLGRGRQSGACACARFVIERLDDLGGLAADRAADA